MPTKIEWCHETWNPITGCSPISEGCQNCYARRMAQRLKGRYGYPKDNPFKPGIVHRDKLDLPRKWKKPRMIFVCSMGDLFHPDVNRTTIEDMCETIYECKRHTFLLLTKRPEIMCDFFGISIETWGDNLWLGVTVESPKYLDRIDVLLKIKAAVHFVSIEPMLAPMEILKYLKQPPCKDGTERSLINWVIAGPETGPGKRPCDPAWIRDLYEQCLAAGVPFFDKTKKNWLAREYPK